MILRAYRDADFAGVIDCFNTSVRTVVARHYSAEQVTVWAPSAPDFAAWRMRLASGGVFVMEHDATVAGFTRVEDRGFIDLLYVHGAHQRCGVGRALVNTACDWAAERGALRCESNVSLAARALFEALGFAVERAQDVEYKGFVFRNFRMARELTSQALLLGSSVG